MMEQNCTSRPISASFLTSEEAAAPKEQIIDHHQQYQYKHQRPPSPPKMTSSFVRHTSSSSVISSRSFLSNASSTRTHRRSVVEVSSILFEDNSPSSRSHSERTMERTDTYTMMKNPRAFSNSSRQISYESYEVHSGTAEMRGPEVLSRSSSPHVRVTSDDASNLMSHKQGNLSGSPQVDTSDSVYLDPTHAMDLIRELSFEPPRTSSSCGSRRTSRSSAERPASSGGFKNTSSSVEKSAFSSTNQSWSSNEIPHYGGLPHGEPAVAEMEVVQEYHGLPPPAPPSISPPLPPKINRLSFDQHGMDHNQISSVDVMPHQIMHNRNRARSTSISEMSESYLNDMMLADDSSSKSSTRSSKNDGSEDEDANEKKSLITIENNIPQSPRLAPRPVSLFTSNNRSRSASVASGQSSYVSSSSSSSSDDDDDLTFGSSEYYEEEDVVEEEYIEVKGLGDPSPNQDCGALSLQDGECNAVDSGTDAHDQNVRQLTLDNLREWNIICEEELAKGRGIVARPQFVVRATSCPNKIHGPERGGSYIMEQDEGDQSVQEPHLLASPLPLGGAISPSLFSYTNSGRSTISSHRDPEELNSELAFDIDFIHSYSMEKSSISASTHLDGADRLNKCHRRCRSSGSRLGKPVCLTKVLTNLEDGRANKPCLAKKHRRFKSDGILCNRLGVPNPVLSQVNLSFTEAPSFKSKYRHQRGKSLDSFTGSQFFDCSPLQCIIEEASKSSQSDDEFPLLGMVDFLKQYLESLSPIRVLELGFMLGLIVGVMVPFVLSMY